MKLTIDLSPTQTERLRQEAERLGELARAAIADLLASMMCGILSGVEEFSCD
jgi:hypothetical protein